jgi:outer membrane protein assembly factor BamA
MEDIMKRDQLRQVLFLLFLAAVIVFVMGFCIVTSAKAVTPSANFLPNRFSWTVDDSDEDFDEDFPSRKWRRQGRWEPEVRYNRVEGLYTGMKLNKDGGRRRYASRPSLYGFFGNAFAAKELQYQIGIEKGFFEEFRLAFGGEYHRRITTPDLWIMPEEENSLAAFLIKEDFHDYYYTEGKSGTITQNFTSALKLSATYQSENLRSEKRHAKWSLFGGHKVFRENPRMDEGLLNALVGRLVIDTRNSVKRTTRGWYIQLEGERAGDDFGGDFKYDRLLADLRRFQPLGFGEGLDLRIRVGTATGGLPSEKSYHLGGVSTLRGFSYKAFPDTLIHPAGGNRMVLAQLEYRLGRDEIPDMMDLGFLDNFNLILFTDAGWAASVDSATGLTEGFEGLTLRGLKHDVGIALANRAGNCRLEVARRTDTGQKPYTFWFRISRPF